MSDAAHSALALVVVAIILFAAAAVADEGAARTGERTDVTAESFTPQGNTGDFIDLDNSNSDELTYSDDVQVSDKNGNHSIEGQDYIWNEDNGTIKPLAGGNLEGDNSATIDYIIWNPTEQDENVRSIITTVIDSGQWIPLLLLVVLVVFAIGFFGRVN